MSTHLKNLNIDVIKVPCNNNLYPAINGHVDIQLNILNSDTKTIILNKDIDNFNTVLRETLELAINSINIK